jgi:hypothetical protein
VPTLGRRQANWSGRNVAYLFMGKIREAGLARRKTRIDFKFLSAMAINLAKVGVEGSNPFARSNFSFDINSVCPTHEKRIRQLPAKSNANARRSTSRVPFVRFGPIGDKTRHGWFVR